MSAETKNNYQYGRYEKRHIPNYRKSTYVDGNTVRQLNAVPNRREEERIEREKRRKRQLNPGNIAIPGVSVGNIIFIACVSVVLIAVSASFINMQNKSVALKKQVVSLQTEIQEQKTLNNEKYEEILNGVDLAQIYKRATRKLNMVRAENNQVYKYKNKKSDMVKQYADIPGTQKNK
jgi:cell division protein FtsL